MQEVAVPVKKTEAQYEAAIERRAVNEVKRLYGVDVRGSGEDYFVIDRGEGITLHVTVGLRFICNIPVCDGSVDYVIPISSFSDIRR